MSAKVMRSLRFAEFGPPSVLRLEDVPVPEPSKAQTLVREKMRVDEERRDFS
jgi:NADPH:quinone reductase-like Zn-dependent oxidoreductase